MYDEAPDCSLKMMRYYRVFLYGVDVSSLNESEWQKLCSLGKIRTFLCMLW